MYSATSTKLSSFTGMPLKLKNKYFKCNIVKNPNW